MIRNYVVVINGTKFFTEFSRDWFQAVKLVAVIVGYFR